MDIEMSSSVMFVRLSISDPAKKRSRSERNKMSYCK